MTETSATGRPSVNALAAPLVQRLVDEADALGLAVRRLDNGSTVIDAGIEARGGIEAGRRIAEVCLGGLGSVKLRAANDYKNWIWHLDVHTSNPVLACLASQYAGWSLSHGEGKKAFRAMGSGPARAMGSKEELFHELGYRDPGERAALVLEVGELPPVELADKVAAQCGIGPENLTLVLTPTSSLAGCVQVVARVLEVALHKVHALGFPLDAVVDGAGTAPVCPPSGDFLTAMGRTNDAILFAGQVHLFVEAGDDDARDLAEKLPASASKDYGRPFAQVFKDYGYDFYKIDPFLFSPARVRVTVLGSGNTYSGGALDEALLDRSFGAA